MKYTTLSVALLFGCMGAVAQSQTGSSTTGSGSTSGSTTSATSSQSDQSGKKMVVSGCISERNGRYILTNSSYPGGIELNTTEDLKAHVGHKVQITGTSDQNSLSS